MDATMGAGMAVDLEEVEVDLFGDPVAVSLMSAPRPPPSKQLLSRLDEMRGRGCCQKIAWSRQGTIASVSADGRSVDLRYLRSHPDDAAWGLSDPTPYSSFGIVPPQAGGGQIAHLAWASSGIPELAVVDDVGRVSFIHCPVSLNRPFTTRAWDADPVDELGAIVGCFWLPLAPPGKQQYTALQGPAVREGNGWRYETSYKPVIGPSHPNPSKSAFVCITAGGMLKMFYSQPNNKVQEALLELENIGSSDDLVTHASICPDKSSSGLCIALALSSRLLKVVKVTINWGLPPQMDKQNLANTQPLNPTFKEKRVAVVSWMSLAGPTPEPEPPLDISMAHISLLELLPTTLASNNQQGFVPPLILAVRSHVSPFSHVMQSVLDAWEIVGDQAQSAQPQALHPAFQQLSSRAGTPATQPATRLRRWDPIWLDKVVVSIQLLHQGRVVCLAFSDGTVQHRDRYTLEVMYASPDLERISALDGLGFRFADETPCLQVAFSPTSCSFVQICEDSRVRWNSLRYPAADIGSTTQDAQYHAVVAGLALTVAAAASSQTNHDDILAIGRQFIDKPRFAYDWVMEVARMLKIHIDYSEEAHHDQLVRNHHLQLCLSILHHMGLYGEFNPRSFGGKFGAVALGVRSIVILITIASHTYKADKLVPLDEPDVVDALATGSKWTLDVLSWLAESLFDLADDPKFEALLNPTDWKNVVEYLHSRNNDVALHLLLCSSTRGFIQAACRRLVHLDSLSHRATDYYEKNYTQVPGQDNSAIPSNRLHLSYQRMQRYTSSSLIKVAEFGELLSALGSDIRTAYETMLRPLAERQRQQQQRQQQQQQQQQQGNKTQQQQQQQGGLDQAVKRAQAQCELTILLGNAPPPAFIPVLKKFFEVDLPAFRAQTDRAQLFFADFALLDVLDDPRSLQERRARGKHIDAFKRSEIELVPRDDGREPPATGRHQQLPGANGSTGALLRRRCVRCAAVMEDVTAQKPAVTFVIAQQRKCPCGGCWGLLAKGATVG
ncbi:hypothetical protein MAPG_03117 [Magnaporthiopsis poae ATCC 64411]|uniref:Mediator of RNA polymerase II transcription subunit 16 n=1 Tax=Magnaporthiopsis poae (strain ATCC 64411 / 73-15) TaxID=644358 RepID=A0A0C4DT60_MAGP6|nr:hypothetical protein MAPG_03117 [Magnaporthiopsis poae ATCC 64411]